MNVCKFGPGEALHVDVNLSTVCTLVRVWVHPSKTDSPSVPQEVWETVHMHTGWVGCHHARCFTKSVLVSGASRKLHTWKLYLHIASWFWRGSLWQQKSSASNLAFFSTQVKLYCLGIRCVSSSMAIHLNNQFQGCMSRYKLLNNKSVLVPPICSQSLGIKFFHTCIPVYNVSLSVPSSCKTVSI